MRSNKGIALYLVLAVLAVTIVLANIVMRLMINESRMTYHKTSRIKSQYAAMAGVNYGMEMLREELSTSFVGARVWAPPAGGQTWHDLCVIDPSMCQPVGADITNPIQIINIIVDAPNGADPIAPESYRIRVNVEYSFI